MPSERASVLRFVAAGLLLGWGVRALSGHRRTPDEGGLDQRPRPMRLRKGHLRLAGGLLLVGLIAAAGLLMLYRYDERMEQTAWAESLTGGNSDRAPMLMVRNGCASCHRIEGVPGAHGMTGPPLKGLAERQFIAGVLPNTPGNLVAWIRDARSIDPKTAMPSTLVPEKDARDMAAYLYTLGN